MKIAYFLQLSHPRNSTLYTLLNTRQINEILYLCISQLRQQGTISLVSLQHQVKEEFQSDCVGRCLITYQERDCVHYHYQNLVLDVLLMDELNLQIQDYDVYLNAHISPGKFIWLFRELSDICISPPIISREHHACGVSRMNPQIQQATFWFTKAHFMHIILLRPQHQIKRFNPRQMK